LEILTRSTRITRKADSYEIIMAVITSYSYKLLPLSSRDEFARDLALKNRCTLKSKDPLIADENNVLRQRSAVLREEPIMFLSGSRSCQTLDTTPPLFLILSLFSESGEPITDNHFLIQLASGTWNCFKDRDSDQHVIITG